MKYITKYSKDESYQNDLSAGNVSFPNISWTVDKNEVYYRNATKLVYYGRIPKSVVITDYSNITTAQIRYYLDSIQYDNKDKVLEIKVIEGDKLLILYPVWVGNGGIYKNDGFGNKVEFNSELLGTNGVKTISLNNSSYYIYGEIATVAGIYKVGIK